jgi:[acyl-carrier-protein] S-malonyltransferase
LRRRGEAMQQAVPVGEGAMAALLGADLDLAKEIAAEASATGVCAMANDNAPGQVVLSGAKVAVDRAVEIAQEKGVRKAVLLPVSAPFHCPLMAPAADIMAEALAAVDIRPPAVPVFANVSARAETEPDAMRDLLVRQVTAMVRWRECVAAMRAAGAEMLVEAGAGAVLKGLTKRIDREIEAVAVGEVAEVESFLNSL